MGSPSTSAKQSRLVESHAARAFISLCIYGVTSPTLAALPTQNGSAYGIVKDCRNALLSRIPVRMKIENLYFTGQNMNVHGCLGVCASAAVTCSALLGEEYLVKKIGNA